MKVAMNPLLLPISMLILANGAFADTSFFRNQAGRTWQDGILIGDGATGAMAYAPAGLEWVINRNDILDTRVFDCRYQSHETVMETVRTSSVHSVFFLRRQEGPTIKGEVDGDRLPLSVSAALLRVRFWDGVGWAMPAIPRTSQCLDTETGELTEIMASVSLTPRAISFVERSRDVMVLEVSDPKSSDRTAVIELARPDDFRLKSDYLALTNVAGAVAFSQRLPGGETYAVALSVPSPAVVRGPVASVRVSGRHVFYLAVRTTRDGSDPLSLAVASVRAAQKDGFDRVRSDHRSWWHEFWSRGARANFASEPVMDTQWHYALYALASQFGSAPMPGLNGLSYGPVDGGMPGVDSNCYVHDQNVQIPMMPFFPLNHAEFVRVFAKTYVDAQTELERRTKEVFGVDGIYLPLNMSQFGREHPVAEYRYSLCGSAYSGLVLAQAWWYSRNVDLLREIYPLLKKFILFYMETMTRESDGTYRFIWSVPPEIFTGTHNDTATISCLKSCLETAIEASVRFGVDAAERNLWRDVLAHYPRTARHSQGGWWCGPEVPDDHYMFGGHLFYPFFPAESDIDAETAKRTLNYVWSRAIEVSHETVRPHPVHEWSAFYTGMARTRLFGGAEGWCALTDFYDHFAKPSGLFSHNSIVITEMTREEADANVARLGELVTQGFEGKPMHWNRRGPDDLTANADAKALVPPVLEGAAAFLMLANETLLQTWGGKVRLFPSVPSGFTGSFENFRTRDGRFVSAEMKDGRVVRQIIQTSDVLKGE